MYLSSTMLQQIVLHHHLTGRILRLLPRLPSVSQFAIFRHFYNNLKIHSVTAFDCVTVNINSWQLIFTREGWYFIILNLIETLQFSFIFILFWLSYLYLPFLVNKHFLGLTEQEHLMLCFNWPAVCVAQWTYVRKRIFERLSVRQQSSPSDLFLIAAVHRDDIKAVVHNHGALQRLGWCSGTVVGRHVVDCLRSAWIHSGTWF